MSISSGKALELLSKRSKEFDGIIHKEISARDRFYAKLYREQASQNRLDLDTILPMVILNWRKDEHAALIQPFDGTCTMEDLRCIAQDIEEDVNQFIWHVSEDAMQYSAIKVMESTPKIHRVNAGVFGINTCDIDTTDADPFLNKFAAIRDRIHRDDFEDKDIFNMDFLIFPIDNGDESACIVVINPGGLLQSAERLGKDRGKCSIIEIRTGIDTMEFGNAKKYIGHILNLRRRSLFRGAFREKTGIPGEDSMIPYDEFKQIEIPLIGENRGQFQLLWMLREILKNGQDIQAYFDGPAEQMGQDVEEVEEGIKLIRRILLREISDDVHENGTEIQQYIFEKRIRELYQQEYEKKKAKSDCETL